MTYPIPAIGQRLTASFISQMLPTYVYKPASTTRASLVVAADDTDLAFAAEANVTYDVYFRVRFAGLQAAGIRTKWNVPAGANGLRCCQGPGSANAVQTDANTTEMRQAVHGFTTDVLYTNPRNSASLFTWLEEWCTVTMAATAGNITFQWAQNVTNATGTVVQAESFVQYRRVA